jgi:pilus assembly protein CpaE
MPDDKLTILIADEDADSRVEMRKVAQRAHYAVTGETGYGRSTVAAALEAQPDVVLLAVEEPVARSLETIEALANAIPQTPCIAYSSLQDAETVRRCMVLGARDYLVLPVQPARLAEVIEAALLQEERRQQRGAGQMDAADARGTVIAVTGAKGGIGKTVISVNLAVALARLGRSVAVVDADTDFGDVATMLDVDPLLTLGDAVRSLDCLDRESIREFLTPHDSGVEVLAGPPDEETWEQCRPPGLRRMIDLLAESHDFVVVDTRGSFDAMVRACVEGSTLTLVVTSGEVSSIRDTAAALTRLSGWDVDPEKVKVVLNQSSRANGVKVQEVSESLGREVFWQAPLDRAVPPSVQVGRPVMLDGSSPLARSLWDLAGRLLGARRVSNPTPPPSMWSRLLGRVRG